MRRFAFRSLRKRRLTLADVRTSTGVVVGLYVTLHLSNHALGLISLSTQEAVRPWVMMLWHSPPGQVLLYGSLISHAGVALYSVARRRHLRMPTWERTQILLGLAIPYLLLVHIVNTRGTRILTGIDISYPYEIANLWVNPWTRFCQISLVLLVWGHFVVGLHFWWRLYEWYRRAFPALLLAYVLIPAAALLGFAEVGVTMTDRAKAEPQWFQAMKAHGVPADPHRAQLRAALKEWAPTAWSGVVTLVLLSAQVRNWLDRRHRFKVTYPVNVAVEAPIGMSVLEVSRMVHRPHMSVCGGRARCTTCRVQIDHADGDLPEPRPLEAQALERIGAPPKVRLGCQLRPTVNLSVRPLLHPSLVTPERVHHHHEFGHEREITILFVDVRDSTSMAETRLPYDVVFILNHLFSGLTNAIEKAGGYYSNFTGDGLMALFGLEKLPDKGARASLECALAMFEALQDLNASFRAELEAPIAIGVGIHTGEAIIGQMGPPKTPIVSAIGSSVNTAARLESSTKELHVPLVVAASTLRAASLNAPLRELQVRGQSSTVSVAALDVLSLRELLSAAPSDSRLSATSKGRRAG